MNVLRRVSFSTKVLVSFTLIIALSTGLGYLFISRSVDRAFADFSRRNLRNQGAVSVQLLSDYYTRQGSWAGLELLLLRSRLPFPFLLVDQSGTVLVSPDPRRVGERVSSKELAEGLSVEVGGEVVGRLLPEPPLPSQGPLEQRFLRAVTRALFITAWVAAAAGLVLAALLLRQLTDPLKRLDVAAREIARGDLAKRVAVQSRDELGHLAESFNAMAASLEKAETSKRQMIADVAHELRTPISAVRAGLEGLRDGVLQPTSENFAALHDRVLLTSRLVADLQELALADAGALSLRLEACDLRPILERIRATIGVELEDESVTLVIEVPEDLPPVEADGQRVEQVMLNLLSNASRHTPAGGTIHVSAAREGAQFVRTSVCDTGSGLSSEDLVRVFDRFYRADKARAGGSGGAGLGLSIAKALVEAHGGRIWAENRPAGGACFHFTLRVRAEGGQRAGGTGLGEGRRPAL